MRKLLLLLALPLIIFSGCTKTRGLTGPEGPSGSLKGNIIGYVDLFDEYGNLQSLDGVKVFIEGTADTVQTNTYGAFVFDSIKAGTYNIDFNKSGYGSTKLISFQLTGGNDTYISAHIEMSKIPDYSVTSVSVTESTGSGVGSNYAVASGSFNTSDQQPKSVIVFVGTGSTVSSTVGTYYYAFTGNSGALGNYTVDIDYGLLHSSGFPRGSTVYVAVYGSANVVTSSSYVDPGTGSTVYNAVSQQTPATTSFVVDK